MSDYYVTSCNRLNRELERLAARHRTLIVVDIDAARDAATSYCVVEDRRNELRKQVAADCAAWFEVTAS